MRIFRFFANAAFIFGALFILNSCEVGLGESVDVTAPVLEISSPADGSIIMNTFKMRGVGYDDTNIALIKVSVKSTSNGKEYASYYATADAFSKQWSVDINNKTKDANGNSKHEIPDGEYTVTVTAMDSAGRTTEKSRVYRIDNTPPVVVIKRPGAADSFGRTIKLTGDIADTNSLSSLYFTAFRKKEDGSLEKIRTIRQANISGVGLEYVIGKKYDNPANDNEIQLNNLYKELYGKEGYDGTSTLYCMVEVADCAREYEAPASEVRLPAGGEYTEAGFAPSGNLSRGFFVYNTIYSTIYSDKGYGLANSDLVSIYNGSYTGSKAGAVNEIKSYLEQNMMTTTGEPSAERMSMFTVNPNNFPYYEVSGYKYEADSSGVKKFSSLSNESKITVTVAPGRDQIDLDEKTVKLLLKKCNDNGEVIEGDDAETAVLVHSQTEIDAMTDDEEKAEAQKVRDAALSKDDTIKIVTGIGKRKTKCNYLVVVDGTDIDGNGIEASDGEKFGFFVVSVNKPPIISITEGPEDLSIAKDCNFTKFSGNVTMYADEVSLYCSITAKDEKGDAVYPVEPKEVKIPVDPKDFTWELELTDENVRNQFGVTGVPENSLCLYTISFRAVDNDENESGDTVRRVHVDTEAPKVEKINISPINTFNDRNCVNGKISISANVSENYELDRMHVYLKVGDNKCYDMSSSNLTLDFNYDTKLLKKNGTNEDYEGDLVVEVRAMDTAGNWSEVKTEKIYVNQESDKPVIRFSNTNEKINDASKIKQSSNEILNLFDKTGNNKIIANITDDDEVDQVVMRYKKLSDPDTDENWHVFVNESGLGTTSYPLSATLVVEPGKDEILEEGLYNIRYEITDKKTNGELPVQISNEFVIGIDAAAPTLIVTTASGAFIGEKSNFVVKGTLEEGSGEVELTRNGTKENIVITPKGDSNTSWDWIYNGKAGTEGDSYTFRAVDKFGKVTEQAFSYKVDNTNPLVELESSGETVYLGTNLSTLMAFKGTAEDPVYKASDGKVIKTEDYENLTEEEKAEYHTVDASGINHVEYTINGTDWVAASGTTKWSANIDFKDSVKNTDDNKKIEVRFRAVDNSNLAGEEKTSTVIIDSELPEITDLMIYEVDSNNYETKIDAQSGIYYIEENSKFVIKGKLKEKNFDKITCSTGKDVSVSKIPDSDEEYSFSYLVEKAEKGTMAYTFTAVDLAGQSKSSASINVFVDGEAPKPEFTAVTPIVIVIDGSKNYVNGIINISGTASDNDKVAKTYLVVTVDGEEKAKFDVTGSTTDTNGAVTTVSGSAAERFNLVVDTTKYTEEEKALTLQLVSVDRAGISGSTPYSSLVIKQSTDKPQIKFTNLDESVTEGASVQVGTNLFETSGNNKLLGTVTDDDGVKTILFEYKNMDKTYVDSDTGWHTLASIDAGGSTSYGFTVELPSNMDEGMDEGLYQIRYTVTDDESKKSGKAAVSSTNAGSEFYIGIDNGNPIITILGVPKGTDPETYHVSGGFLGASTDLRIVGTVTDGNLIGLTITKSVEESEAPGKIEITGTGKTKDWIHSFTTGTGGAEIKYVAKDRFGKTTPISFRYIIDTINPEVTLTSPAAGPVYIGTTLSTWSQFSGTANDPGDVNSSSGINHVEYSVDGGTKWANASGTTSWSANVDFSTALSATKVLFKSVDNGGLSTPVIDYKSIDVVIDQVAPVITITGIKSGEKDATQVGTTYYVGRAFTITGKVTEKYLEKIEAKAGEAGPEGVLTEGVASGDDLPFTYDVTLTADGTYSYTFNAVDMANQTAIPVTITVYVDTVAPVPAFSSVTPVVEISSNEYVNGKIKIQGTSSDNDYVSDTVLNLYVDGATVPTYSLSVTGTDTTVITKESTNTPGRYTFYVDTKEIATDTKPDLKLEIVSTDRSGNKTMTGSVVKTYKIDQSTDIPTLEFSNADKNLIDAANISNEDMHNLFGLGSNIIYGTATDDDGIASITYVIDEGKTGEINGSVTVTGNPTTKSISLDLTKVNGGNVISSGNHTIKFVIKDSADGVTYTSPATAFAYDNDSPLIYVTKINSKDYVSGMWTPADLSISGTATDNSGVKSVYVKTIDGVAQSVPDEPGLIATGKGTSSATWQSSLSNQGSGDHIVVYAVTDIYGRSFETTVTFKVDTVVPAFDTNYITLTGSVYGVNKVIKLKDYNENAQWFDNGNIKIDGIAGKEDSVVKPSIIEENPKLLTITYAENQSATPNMGVNNNFSSTITFDDTKQSSFRLTIEDEAGNKKTIGPFNVRIDSTAPIEPNISLYNEYDSEKSDVKSGSDVDEYVNRSTIYAKYSSSDETSGIAKVEIFQDATYSDDKLLASKEAAADEVIDEGVISLNLSALPATTYTFAVRVTDRAGKESKKIAKPFIYDMIAPVVGYTTPSENAIVNKTITVRGTITETNVPKGIQTGETDLILKENADKWKAELYVKKEGDADYKKVSDAVIKIKSDKSWTFDIDTTNATYFADKKTATFQLRVTDAAGNTVQNTGNSLTVNVNQDSDRPIITLTSINTNGTTTLSNGTIKGTIEDDDGLTGLSMFVQIIDVDSNVSPKEEFSNADSAWKAVTMDGSSWSYTYSKGEGVKIDGNYKIYFKIVDAKSSSFYTSDSGSQPKPKVVYEKGSPVVNGISFAIDQNPPTIVEFQYATSTTENGTYTDYTDLNFNTVLGGSLYPYAKFRVKAEDSVLDTPDLRVSMTMLDNTPVVMTYNKEGETEGYFYTNPIRLNVAASSQYYAVASAADNSGNPSTRTINVIIDNTAPETISDMNISSSDEVTGSISLSGMASDDNKANSGIKEIFVYVPKKGTSSGNPVNEYGAGTVAQARDITSDEWKQAEWSATWAYTLNDSNIIGSILLDSGAVIRPEYSGYRDGAANIYQIPVWFKLVDKAGNIGYNVSNSIKFNPDADKPRTTIIYPEENLPGAGFNYVVLGGTIRFSGTAIDDEGIEGVYLQFDMNNDGEWDNGILSGDTMISGVKYTSAVVVDIPVAGGKGIKANGNQAWWYSLDVSGFGNTLLYDSVNKHCLKVRAIAIDTGALDARKAGEWTDVLHISVNTNVPAFESVELKQFANATDPSAISTMPYLSGKYISGTNWYIVGSVTTAAGFAETPFSTEWIAGDNTVSLTKIPVEYIDSSDGTIVKKYEFRIPVKVTSGTEWSVKITATDNTDNGGKSSDVTYSLNIDNDAPRFYSNDIISGEKIKLYRDAYGSSGIALDSTVDNSLKNSNGRWATISGRVTEEGSGYDKIVMYFKRSGSTTRVYNPMSADGRINIDTSKSSSSKNSGDIYINSEELPVKYLSGLGRTGGEYSITLPAEDSNIRTGGIVKIGGVYRLISTVSGTTVTLAESCATSYTEAEFVYGMVVDKNGESLDTDGITVKKDDGDGMVESFSKSGTNYTWDASIPSANIPDGPIEVHTVVFDAAGNNRHGFAETWVRNNSPRIARVTLATDLNGNLDYSDAGESQFFSVLSGDDGKTNLTDIQKKNITSNVWNLDTKAVLETAEYWSIKNGLQITPEFVGGTAPFYWTMSAAEGQQNISSPETFAGGTSSTKKIAANKTDFEIENSAFASGEYKDFENKNNTYRFSFWDSTEETVPGSSENGSQWSVLNIRMRQDVKDEVKPSVIVRPFYWYGRGLEKSTNTKEISESFTYRDVKGNTNYTALYTDAACKVPVTASTELSATVYAKKVVPVNSLYETFSENGHIEVETDLSFEDSPFTTGYGSGEMDMDPKVSGKIVIQGTAYDNVSLDTLWLSITDKAGNSVFTAGNAVSETAPSGIDGIYVCAGKYSAGSWTTPVAELGTNYWQFEVDDEYFNQFGHRVNWTLTLDTEHIDGVALADVKVTVLAVDRSSQISNVTSKTAASGEYNSFSMDVVPYITSVTTSLGKLYNDEDLSAKNKSVYGRTALGKYPVYETEEITVCGFNIPTTAAVKVGTTDLTGNSGSRNEIVRQIPSNTASGELVVSVSGVTNLNNKNKDSGCGEYSGSDVEQFYNMQPNGINNNLLNDDIALDVWTFEAAARPRDGEILTPEMQIGPNGEVGFAFVNGNFYFNMAGPSTYGYTAKTDTDGTKWASQRSYEGDYAPYYESALAFDAKGMTYGISTNQDSNVQYSAYTSFYFGQRGNDLYGKPGWNAKSSGNYRNGPYRRRLQSTTSSLNSGDVQDTSVFRAMSPSVATVTNANDTSVYLAFYDAVRHEIRYRWGNIGNILEKKIDSVTSSEQEYKQITKVDEEGSGWRYGHIEAGYLANNEKNITNYNLNNTSFSKAYGGGEEVYLYKADGTLYEKDGQNKFYTGYNFNKPGTWFRIHKTNKDDGDIDHESKAISPFPSYNKDAGNKTNRWYLSKKYYSGGLKLDVINATNHGLEKGDEITLTFENNRFMNEKYTRVYYVNNVLDTNRFTVSSEANSDVCTSFFENPPKAFSKITGQIIDASGGYSTAKVKPGTDTGTEDKSVRSALYSVVDTTSATKMTAAVAIGAVPASVAGTTNDVAVIAWFDGTSQKLKYAYEEAPQRDDDNVPSGLFQSSPYTKRIVDSNAGYYVHLKVDASGGIHIAYFTTTGAKLKYGYAKDYKSEFNIVTVDSFNLNGNNDIGLDVAKDSDGNWTPYISYLAGAQAAKVAYPVKWEGNKPKLAGQDSSGKYSQNWEISFVPSENRTPKNDTVCVGVHKLWTSADAGLIQPIPVFAKKTNVSGDDKDSNQSTRIGGNGTANPALAYTIIEGDILQYAQKN